MNNRDISAAWAYHDATKHSYWSVRNPNHVLDMENYPIPFKIYPDLAAIRLPPFTATIPCNALTAVSSSVPPGTDQPPPDPETLAGLLYLSAGITRKRNYPGGEIYFRAASHTGAMYAIELYLVCGNLPELEAGVYHFGPGDFSLRRLRGGDFRGILVGATDDDASVAHAPVIVVSTGIYWRNAWKYQTRTYRHFGWDNGTLLANLLAAATGLGLSARVVLGFQDDRVNQLLGIDPMREVSLSLVPVGYSREPPMKVQKKLEFLTYDTIPYSRKEVDYPIMREMQGASSLVSEVEIRDWPGPALPTGVPPPQGNVTPLNRVKIESAYDDSIDRVIRRRGSTRRFASKSITLSQLSIILYTSTRGTPSDFLDPPGTLLNDLYLIVHAVEGLQPGAYVFRREELALERLKAGDFRREAGHLGLDQELPAVASCAIFFLADLNNILERFGNRGYRAVQLEAGILVGKMYLEAYAQRLGATGLTFYDDEVIEFFSPHAAGKSSIFLMAIGKPHHQGDSRNSL